MKREAKIAGAGPLADFSIGQRVMTVEGYPGTVEDIHEGPADLTTIFVTLDGGMGGGEYAEAELSPLSVPSTAARNEAAIIEAGVTHTAADDYPELGSILSDRLPPTLQRMAGRTAGATDSDPYMLVWMSGEDEQRHEMGFSNWEAAYAYGQGVAQRGDTWPNRLDDRVAEEYPGREYSRGVFVGSNLFAVVLGWEEGHVASKIATGDEALHWGDLHEDMEPGETFVDPPYDEDQHLGSRLPFSREAGASIPGKCKTCDKAIKIEKGNVTHADGSNEHAVVSDSAPIGMQAAMIPAIADHLIPAQLAQYPQHPMHGDGIAYFKGEISADMHVDCLLYYLDDDLVAVLNHFPEDMGPERKGNVLVLVHPDFRRQGIGKALWVEAVKRWGVKSAQQDTTPSGAAFLRATSLYLPPVPESEQRSSTTEIPEGQRAGFAEGKEQGKVGLTREPSNPTDIEFMAGFDLGWAEGVTVAREPANSWNIDDLGKDQTADVPSSIPSAFGPSTATLLGMPMVREAGSVDEIKDWVAENGQPGSRYSYDWCRFRKNSHCFLPSGVNTEASERAGYAVLIPMDRGYCWRSAWETQEKCETGMPGPKADGFTDATVSWEAGGQRNGTPDPGWQATLTTYSPQVVPGGVLSPKTASFEFTAAWKDVRKKAKRIREAGGVTVVASRDNVIVGHVKGDNGVYETEIVSFPGKRNAATWACGCKWSSYSWGRSGPWKRFEGRMCSHALALQYEAMSRGMNGKEITLDTKQPAWMKGQTLQHSSSLHVEASPVDDHLRKKVLQAATLEAAAAAMLALARREEPKVVQDLTTLIAQNHGEMVGLEHRIKSGGSLLRKMKAEATLFKNPGEAAMNMSDTLRFTALFPPEDYTQDTKDVLSALNGRGYKTRVKNYWGRGDAYNGVNVALTTPGGHPCELQFHTEESFSIKEEAVHPIYEKWREETNPNRKAILGYQMRGQFDMAHRPPGVLGIEGLKKQPFTPYNQIDWYNRRAASLGDGYRYLALHKIDDMDDSTPDEVYAVLRVTDASSEVWEHGQWLDDPEFGRYSFLGDPTSDEISETEAYVLIGEIAQARVAHHRPVHAQADDEVPAYTLAGSMKAEGAKYATIREMLLSVGVAEPAKVVASLRTTAAYITEQQILDGSLDVADLGLVNPDGSRGPSFLDWVKQAKDGKNEGVPYSEHGDDRLKDAGVSVAKDDKGYYVHTHRARGKSHDTVAKIPDSEIESIEATGSRHPFREGAMGEGWMLNGKPYTDGVWMEAQPDKWYRGSAQGEIPSACYASLSEGKWEWMARAFTFIGAPHENRAGAGPARGSAKTLEQAQAKGQAALRKDQEFFEKYEERQRAKGLIASLTVTADEDQCPHCAGDSLMSGGVYTCEDGHVWHPDSPEARAFHDDASPIAGRPLQQFGEFWPIPGLMLRAAKEQQVEVSGVALMARDTGRVLFLQRALTDNDDNGGRWEFPGGHHEDGDITSLHAGIREWEEEVGQKFPEGGEVVDTWTSPDGIYRGHIVAIDEEAQLELHVDRVVDNPDEDGFEQAAWWAVEDARKNPALREECKDTPWAKFKVPNSKAAHKEGSTMDIADEFGSLFDDAAAGIASGPIRPVATAHEAGAEWGLEPSYNTDETNRFVGPNTPHPGMHHQMDARFVEPPRTTIDDNPEAALPVTYGDDESTMAQQISAALGAPHGTLTRVAPPVRSTAASVSCPKCGSGFEPGQDIEVSAGVGLQHKTCPRTAAVGRPETEAEKGRRLLAYVDASLSGVEVDGPNPFAHIQAGQNDNEMAAAAQNFLATKTALKTYDPMERQSIIDEGVDVQASNLDRLDIAGTHYEALAARAANNVPEDEDMTFLDGDPNLMD